jgi:hypothetical protein
MWRSRWSSSADAFFERRLGTDAGRAGNVCPLPRVLCRAPAALPEQFTFAGYTVASESGAAPTVTLRVLQNGVPQTVTITAGDGPIDGIFLAIEKLTGMTTVCRDFRVQAVTVGKDAQAEVTVELEHAGQQQRGRGVSTDSLEAAAKAFLAAVNRLALGTTPRLHPQQG